MEEYYPEIQGEKLPAEFETLAGEHLSRIENIVKSGGALTSDFKEMVGAVAGMNVEINRLQSQLAAYAIGVESRLQMLSVKAPIIERQLDGMARRLDCITERIMGLSDNCLDEMSLKRQGMLLDTLNRAGESFNNVIMQLMMC